MPLLVLMVTNTKAGSVAGVDDAGGAAGRAMVTNNNHNNDDDNINNNINVKLCLQIQPQ